GRRSATTGGAQIRPGDPSSLCRKVPSSCQISKTSARGTMISRVPSPSRSAIAGEPSQASCQRSNKVALSSGARTTSLPPSLSQLAGGSDVTDVEPPLALDPPLPPAPPTLPPPPPAPEGPVVSLEHPESTQPAHASTPTTRQRASSVVIEPSIGPTSPRPEAHHLAT